MRILREIQPSYRAVYYVPISRIHPRSAPPREEADEQKLLALAASIRQYGLLQPITVRVTERGYEIVLGQRRFQACVMLGFTYVDAFVLNANEKEATLYALLENKYQEPPHFLDEAEAYAAMQANGASVDAIARQSGESAETIEKKLRLLALPQEVRQFLRTSSLSERHARALLLLTDAEQQMHVARQAARLRLSPRETEALAEKENAGDSSDQPRRKVISMVWEPRLYLNAINTIIRKMRDAGLDARAEQSEDDACITLNLKIRKTK